LGGDCFHPNETGAQIIAEEVIKAVPDMADGPPRAETVPIVYIDPTGRLFGQDGGSRRVVTPGRTWGAEVRRHCSVAVEPSTG
jgi:hypothetical protein